jgi:signal transduction histidine kinase
MKIEIGVSSFQWATGVFLAATGALMLVAPHQFGAPGYDALRPQLPWWGTAFCLAGGGLLAARIVLPGRWLLLATHTAAATLLVLLARAFALTAIWGSAAGYALLGLAALAAGLMPPGTASLALSIPSRLPFWSAARHSRSTPSHAGAITRPAAAPAAPAFPASPATVARADLLAVVLGVTAVLNGLLLLVVPGAFHAASYDVVRPYATPAGLLFLATGSALLACQLSAAVPRPAYLAAHLLAGAWLVSWAALVMWPNRAWTGIGLYAGFGALVGLMPWWAGSGRLGLPLSSLRARFAIALAGAAAIPLIVAATLIARQEQQARVDEALLQQQTMAGVLAQDAADYIGLHRSAVAALASQMQQLQPDPAAQAALLRTVRAAYPAFVFLGTFDASGRGIARAEGRALPAVGRLPVFDEARRTGTSAIDVLNRPELAQGPVFAVAAPIFLDDQLAGVVLGAVESTHLSQILGRPRVGAGGEVYLVDARGRAVAHPDTALVTSLTDLTALPPVAAVLSEDGDAHALRYRGWSGERLAGYARVPGLGWGIVVERPTSIVLADSYARRDLIFGVLLLAIAGAAGVGLFVAGRLTRSLSALASAADALAAEKMHAPLPQTTTAEVARVTGAFRAMRDRLAIRTAEREEAIRMRDNVLATVSHDLKNPLTTVTLHAHLAQDEAVDLLQAAETGSIDSQREQVADRLAGIAGSAGRILLATHRMQSMIDDLVDTARLQSGQRLDLQRRPMDLLAPIRHVVEEHRQTTERHQFRLELQADELIGVWDHARIERVLQNLVGNAVKYSPEGGEIVIAARRERTTDGREWAAAAVRDHGLGIPAADLPHVFDRFHRASNVAGRIRGTGLGLSSARQVVEQHGGTLRVESREGEGSTFTLRLPIAAAEATGAGDALPERGAPAIASLHAP